MLRKKQPQLPNLEEVVSRPVRRLVGFGAAAALICNVSTAWCASPEVSWQGDVLKVRGENAERFRVFPATAESPLHIDFSGLRLDSGALSAAGAVDSVEVTAIEDGNAVITRLSILSTHRLKVKDTSQPGQARFEFIPQVSAELGSFSRVRGPSGSQILKAPLTGSMSSEVVHIETLNDPPRLLVDIDDASLRPKWQRVAVQGAGVVRARMADRSGSARIVLDLSKQDFPRVSVDVVEDRLELTISKVSKPKIALVEKSGARKTTSAESKAIVDSTSPKARSQVERKEARSPLEDAPTPRPAPIEVGPTDKGLEAEHHGPNAGSAGSSHGLKAESAVTGGSAPSLARTPSSRQAPSQATQLPSKASLGAAENVRFEQKDGFYRLTVDLAHPKALGTVVRKGTEAGPALYLPGLSLPSDLERTIDVSDVAGDTLTSISSFNKDGGVMLVARVEEQTENRFWVKGRRFMWDFRSNAPRVLNYEEASVASFAARAASDAAKIVSGARRYTGRRISLDLKDAEIQNVLRLLADVSKLNIVAADDVQGTITIKLRNVPWDQALDIILRSKQLDKTKNGNIIRVAPIEVLQKEEQARIERLAAQQQLEPLTVRLIPVSYASVDEAKAQAKSLLSPRGTVDTDARTNVLIVKDISDSLVKIERLIRTLDTQTPQVLIEARIIEARSSFTRGLGIQWGGSTEFSQTLGNQTGLSFPANVRIAGGSPTGQADVTGIGATPQFAVNLPTAAGQGTGGALGFVFGSLNNGTVLNLRLSAAEATGRIKIVSAPKIVTLDNRTANILSGEQVPITVVTANGPTTRFIDANISLSVTPHVTQDGAIQMEVQAQKNELSERVDFLGVPGILTKSAQTQMIVKDGDTAVLGGLYRRTDQSNEAYVPWIGKVPVIGWLFKTTNESDARDELLIFISPRIVNRSQSLLETR